MTTHTEVTNAKRAAWANAAVHLFTQLTGTDREDALGDLLCDLMHWAGQNEFDFTAALDRARDHYDAELFEEQMLPPEPPVDPNPDLIAALEKAVTALNTAPRFAVPSLETDSYRIAKICDLAIANAKGAGQ